MNKYLIKKQDFNKFANFLNGIIFRQDYDKDHMRIKFFTKKFEKQVKQQFGNQFDILFKLESND